MKLNLKFQEESIQVLENFYLPDLAVIGGIAVETIVSSDAINTVLGGRGGRITLYLKKLGIKSNVFSFLGQDEYLNFILDTLDSNGIPITWSLNPEGNIKIVRILDKNEKYFTENKSILSVNPFFMDEFICGIKNVFIKYENWNFGFHNMFGLKDKKIYIDIKDKEISDDMNGCYLFIETDDLKETVYKCKKYNFSDFTVFSDNIIFFNGKVYEFDKCEHNYYEEAVSSYESVFIYSNIAGYNFFDSHLLAIKGFEYTYKTGMMIPRQKL